MSKYELQSQVKYTSTAILWWFFLGAHYAYMGKWGLQFLYWIHQVAFVISLWIVLFIAGASFIGYSSDSQLYLIPLALMAWPFIDLFTMSSKIHKHNAPIFLQLEELEKKEKTEEHARNIAMIAAATGNTETSSAGSSD